MKNAKGVEPDPTTPEGFLEWLKQNAKKALDAGEEASRGPKRFGPGEALEDVVPEDLGV